MHSTSEIRNPKSEAHIGTSAIPSPPSYLLSSIAQIFNLPYRRFVIGRALLAGDIGQVKNLRYSRLQVCATDAASTLNTYPSKPAWLTNGQLHVAEYFRRSLSHGLRTKWYPSGKRLSEAHIRDGQFEGTYRKRHENGVLWIRSENVIEAKQVAA